MTDTTGDTTSQGGQTDVPLRRASWKQIGPGMSTSAPRHEETLR